jgi:cytoskeletal protein CcmA (bactofilin family)
VQLKNNSLTIGPQGKIRADVYAHSIYVDGYMEGDLYGSERVHIRKSAQVRGNVTSPRVSLEDGAKFKGSIEMDPQAVQGAAASRGIVANKPAATGAPVAKPGQPQPPTMTPAKPDVPAAVKTGAGS